MYYARIFDTRIDHDLTQDEIAKMLGVTQETYSKWETGKEFIPLMKLTMFCNLFKVNIDYILGQSNNQNFKEITLNKSNIGKNLKTFRKEIKISQLELAKTLNTSQSTVSAYENGHTLILASFAYTISKKYKLSIDWLLGNSNKMFIS